MPAHQNSLTPIEINLDNVERIYRNQSNKELLAIALHGDYKFSSLKNTADELDSQNETFIQALTNYHLDKNLIIIGFSGRDKSLMSALQYAFTKKGSGRLYWCGYGSEISPEIASLLESIRDSDREAHYITTDGFDKTIIHLAKSAFEDSRAMSEEVQEALESSEEEEFLKTEFSLPTSKTHKYIKSNLHPVTFPKEIFQFEVDYKDKKPWAFLREITENTDICAVPFKSKVYALGTLTDLSNTFKKCLISQIKREPISKFDVENVSAFRSLMLQAILKIFCANNRISGNSKNKIWLKKHESQHQGIKIHKSLFLSFYFDKNKSFGYLSFTPTLFLNSDEEITKTQKLTISKYHLEKLYNNRYDEVLEDWKNTIFPSNKLIFDYPLNSGSGFEFRISANTAFGEISVLDPNYRAYTPRDYDTRKTQFRGVQFLEPQLVFRNLSSDKDFKDYHPMRGLVNNRPFDVNLNGLVLSNEINLSVICGKRYSQKLYEFLSKLQTKHPTANINPDYLIDYPGFTSIYNIPLNIPPVENSDNWVNIEFFGNGELETHENAIQLARLITSKIDQIANTQRQSTIVIFIPKEWQNFESYVNNEESFDLHDYIKAYAASKGVATQLIREETLADDLTCQINWWLSLSFYVKSLRTPWILNNQEKDTAYAGIGYSLSKIKDRQEVVIGCSHIYDSNGQGLKYKLSKIDSYVLDKQNNPFLSFKDAFQFGISIRELFYESLNKLPERVVIHKRTRFTENEINGIKSSLNKAGIKKIDLIEISFEPDARFVAMSVFNNQLQIDKFPISRGTCIVTNKYTALLWTHGIVPSVRQTNYKFYLGGRSIPAPIKITKHYGESDIDLISKEILGLTKMNWNSLDLYTKLPSTIDSSNKIARIGRLLSRFEGRTYDYRLFI